MADQSDVETVLVALASGALYPSGTGSASVCGQPCSVYRGWPNPIALDADLAAQRVNVTVYPAESSIRNTTRYPDEWVADPPAVTLTASVAGDAVTFSGTADPGQLAGIGVGNHSYVYRTGQNDTPELVAAYLAAQARYDYIAQLSGATLVLPGASGLNARVVADGTALREVRRQRQRFQIVCWCSDPSIRDLVATSIDNALCSLSFIALGDGTKGRLRFATGKTFDQSEDAALYRRDLLYDVDYPTTISAVQPTMLFGAGSVNRVPFLG